MARVIVPDESLIGKTFGRLTVLEAIGKAKDRSTIYRCSCSCGKEVAVLKGNLRKGTSRSCGCLRSELLSERSATHRQSDSPEYGVWAGLIQRCTNPNRSQFHHYGGRGIKVCERWVESFENFLADMGPRPTAAHKIERKENDGDYEPGNCRWATHAEQMLNTRTNHHITIDGETLTIAEWSRKHGVKQPCIIGRLNRGWSDRDAIMIPALPWRRLSHPGR